MTIVYHEPEVLPLEVAYPDIYPSGKVEVSKSVTEVEKIEFSGSGIVIQGGHRKRASDMEDYVAEIRVVVDGDRTVVRKMPYSYHSRAQEVFFDLTLDKGDHTVELEWLNPVEELDIFVRSYITFSDELVKVPY